MRSRLDLVSARHPSGLPMPGLKHTCGAREVKYAGVGTNQLHVPNLAHLHGLAENTICAAMYPLLVSSKFHAGCRRYFQHAHFIPIMGMGKRGAY